MPSCGFLKKMQFQLSEALGSCCLNEYHYLNVLYSYQRLLIFWMFTPFVQWLVLRQLHCNYKKTFELLLYFLKILTEINFMYICKAIIFLNFFKTNFNFLFKTIIFVMQIKVFFVNIIKNFLCTESLYLFLNYYSLLIQHRNLDSLTWSTCLVVCTCM